MGLYRKLLALVILVSTMFAAQVSTATVFDVRFTGTLQDNVSGTNNHIFFTSQQNELVSNSNIGWSYDFTFRFDTTTAFVSDFTLPGFGGGQAFSLISGSYGSLTDFTMYESQVVVNGTSSSGIDSLKFLLFRDLDEELGYPGSWDNQILFELQDFEGGLFSAIDNLGSAAFNSGILDNTSVFFFAHRNRNGLYTKQQQDVSNVTITAVSSNNGGGTPMPVPEPSPLVLMMLGLLFVKPVLNRIKRS